MRHGLYTPFLTVARMHIRCVMFAKTANVGIVRSTTGTEIVPPHSLHTWPHVIGLHVWQLWLLHGPQVTTLQESLISVHGSVTITALPQLSEAPWVS